MLFCLTFLPYSEGFAKVGSKAHQTGIAPAIEIIGGKFICAAERENKNDFRSNVTNGGTMTPCKPTEKEIETAIKACETLGLTFGGVDILDDGSVCEVNSNAHIINIMNSTKIDIAPYIFETIKEKIK